MDTQAVNESQQRQGQDRPVDFYLDGALVTGRTSMTGIEIRRLGPANRVDGFETQQITPDGKKIRTIGDNETVHVHENEYFRTVPNEGGPGGRA